MKDLLYRMDREYICWYVPIMVEQGYYSTKSRKGHIKYHMQKASIRQDWDALSIMCRVWNNDLSLSAMGIKLARINGNPSLARKIYQNSKISRESGPLARSGHQLTHEIDMFLYMAMYYEDNNVSINAMTNILSNTHLYFVRPGWVSPHMRQIAEKLAKTKKGLGNCFASNRERCILLQKARLPKLSESSHIQNVLHLYPDKTWEELLAIVKPTNMEQAKCSLRHLCDICTDGISLKSIKMIKYILDAYDLKLESTTPILLNQIDPRYWRYSINDILNDPLAYPAQLIALHYKFGTQLPDINIGF